MNIYRVGALAVMIVTALVLPLHAEVRDGCRNCEIGSQISSDPAVMGVYGERGEKSGYGAGMLKEIENGLYIITNNHVIEGATEVFLLFTEGRKKIYPVTVMGRDPAADVALLAAPLLPRGITPVTFGPRPRVLEELIAVGYPFEMRSVTTGFVNNLSSFTWMYFITQVPINPGNSGGPLLNQHKEMVGLNTAIIQGATIAFSLPVEYIEMLLPRLMRESVVDHGYAGFSMGDPAGLVPSFFSKNGISSSQADVGIMVTAVDAESHAMRAGVQVGDAVVKFNGATERDGIALEKKIFFDFRPNDEVTFTMMRGGRTFERRFKLDTYISPIVRMNQKKQK